MEFNTKSDSRYITSILPSEDQMKLKPELVNEIKFLRNHPDMNFIIYVLYNIEHAITLSAFYEFYGYERIVEFLRQYKKLKSTPLRFWIVEGINTNNHESGDDAEKFIYIIKLAQEARFLDLKYLYSLASNSTEMTLTYLQFYLQYFSLFDMNFIRKHSPAMEETAKLACEYIKMYNEDAHLEFDKIRIQDKYYTLLYGMEKTKEEFYNYHENPNTIIHRHGNLDLLEGYIRHVKMIQKQISEMVELETDRESGPSPSIEDIILVLLHGHFKRPVTVNEIHETTGIPLSRISGSISKLKLSPLRFWVEETRNHEYRPNGDKRYLKVKSYSLSEDVKNVNVRILQKLRKSRKTGVCLHNLHEYKYTGPMLKSARDFSDCLRFIRHPEVIKSAKMNLGRENYLKLIYGMKKYENEKENLLLW